jgi:uncharacterized protein YfeS
MQQGWASTPTLHADPAERVKRLNFDELDRFAIQSLVENNLLELAMCDDAMVATAFAAVKLRGCCDAATRELAFKAIKREGMVLEGRGWTDPAERIEGLNQMAEALSRIAETCP